MLHEKAKVLLLSTIFHILKLFSSGPCQKQGAEQDWLLISLPDIWGCEDFAVLNCISRSRGEEKVSKEEIETERIKRVNGREGLLKGLIDSWCALPWEKRSWGITRTKKLWCTEVHILHSACLPVFRSAWHRPLWIEAVMCPLLPSFGTAWSKYLWPRSNVYNLAWV